MLATMMDEDAPDRRWMPMASTGPASATFVDAACHAAYGVDRDVIILEPFANDPKVVQHRVQSTYRVGKSQRHVSDGVLWVPDAAGRAALVPRTVLHRFRLVVDVDGKRRRHVGLPADDIAFGAALAAKRLREIACRPKRGIKH